MRNQKRAAANVIAIVSQGASADTSKKQLRTKIDDICRVKQVTIDEFMRRAFCHVRKAGEGTSSHRSRIERDARTACTCYKQGHMPKSLKKLLESYLNHLAKQAATDLGSTPDQAKLAAAA